MRDKLGVTLTVRVTPELKKAYMEKARQEPGRDPSDVLRELLRAYNEDRLTIRKGKQK